MKSVINTVYTLEGLERLLSKAKNCDEFSPIVLNKVAIRLKKGMKERSDAIAIASNQVIEDKDVCPAMFLYGSLIACDPSYVIIGKTTDSIEGCLSCRCTHTVSRGEKIHLITRFFDTKTKKLSDFYLLEVEGFDATVLQHEIDHLNGKFIDMVTFEF